MKRALVFDWDGTLLNSADYKRKNFIQLFSEEGGEPEKVKSLHEQFTGLPRYELFSRVYGALFHRPMGDQDFLNLSKRYTEKNLLSGKEASLFPEVTQVLKNLKARYFLFVSSASPQEELSRMVETTEIPSFMKEVLGSKLGFSKGPGHFSHILQKYSFEKIHLLFVGNDDQDGQIASENAIEFKKVDRESGQDLRGVLKEYLV